MASKRTTPDATLRAKDDLTGDEIRRLADSVQPGECITFPNGLVVDKRPVWSTQPYVGPDYWPQSTYLCQSCKARVPFNTTHCCIGWKAGS